MLSTKINFSYYPRWSTCGKKVHLRLVSKMVDPNEIVHCASSPFIHVCPRVESTVGERASRASFHRIQNVPAS
ncbi:hypothetical protein XELAEV_18032811mg [Xenopus laevis]|uniref:Uncharacterized protein n=1 Tax=Xenopus laevis TaxID=8355 RepID=A0A974HDF5_XENLA|nr:hypothetical protein XELAEV_18032811mg [Xenopus laevis]